LAQKVGRKGRKKTPKKAQTTRKGGKMLSNRELRKISRSITQQGKRNVRKGKIRRRRSQRKEGDVTIKNRGSRD